MEYQTIQYDYEQDGATFRDFDLYAGFICLMKRMDVCDRIVALIPKSNGEDDDS